ncbi:DUF3862 domain-containing protein [Clostridium rectalis]|uniref:DUF3862 domain-containing protein n=1 Tax=Clostridium rectalis TaxID=2040295 RepID=UPI000F637E97|nr:DUF3862 domain-containing protein [Clostridium rectalis]
MKEQKKKNYKKWWFWLLIIVIVGGIVVNLGGENDKVKNKSSKSQSSKNKKEDIKVNYDNFIKIKMGSTLQEAIAILGEGKEQSSSEISGIKTVMYNWNGIGISNMNITIQNGKVTGKSQVGLKKMDANVSLEKYNKLKNGMSYDEVKAILGEGQILSQSKVMNSESIIYSWMNKNGSNLNCTFSNGKLLSKAQFNLK